MGIRNFFGLSIKVGEKSSNIRYTTYLKGIQLKSINSFTNDSGTEIVVQIPANTSENTLLVLVGNHSNTSATWSASGWTKNIDSFGRVIFTKVFDRNNFEETFSTTASGAKTVSLLSFSGASFGVSSPVSSFDTNPIASSIFIEKNNSLVVGVATLAAAGNSYSAPSNFTKIDSSIINTSLEIFITNEFVETSTFSSTTFTRISGSGTTSRAFQFSIVPTI